MARVEKASTSGLTLGVEETAFSVLVVWIEEAEASMMEAWLKKATVMWMVVQGKETLTLEVVQLFNSTKKAQDPR
jgi:hypothetical protein